MSQFTLRYRHDPSFFDSSQDRDDFGRLFARVQTERFSGEGAFWVQWQDVLEFGDSLSRFPIAEDQPIIGQWGYDMQGGDDVILRFEFVPADSRGNVCFRFEIADDNEPYCRVRGYFLTNYPDIDAFRLELAGVMRGELEIATLNGQTQQFPA